MSHYRNADLAELIHSGGSFSRVLAEFPVDADAPSTTPGPRLRGIIHSLTEAGAPASDIATVTDAFVEHADDRGPVPRFLLVADGVVVLDEFLSNVPLPADEASFGPLPDVTSLLRHRQAFVPYIVLEASAEGGRIRTYLAGGIHPDSDQRIAGDTEWIHKTHGGGLSHARYAHHTEEMWKRNETELADAVNQLVERNDVRLLVVTGDPHVIDLVSNALSARARAILATLASDTIAAGSSANELDATIEEHVQRIIRETQADAIARSAVQRGAANSSTDRRLQPVVHELQQADVETLLLDPEALGSHNLLALGGAPWVASVPAETFGASVLEVSSAARVLTRAAIATDADVIFVDHDSLPGHAGAATIHR
jgi:hypothetical protein